MSEQNAEQSSGEPGSLGAGPAVPHSSDAQSAAGAADAPKVDAAKADAAKADAPKADAPNAEAPQADAPPAPGKVLIMSAGDRNWDSGAADAGMKSESGSAMFGKRRVSAMAAVVALAMVADAMLSEDLILNHRNHRLEFSAPRTDFFAGTMTFAPPIQDARGSLVISYLTTMQALSNAPSILGTTVSS